MERARERRVEAAGKKAVRLVLTVIGTIVAGRFLRSRRR